MGLDASAVSGVGRVFDSVSEVGKWFLENFKGELSERERETLEEDTQEFFESKKRKGMPKLECMDCYSGRGYALYYGFGDNIKKLRENVDKALNDWEQNFKEAPDLLNDVRWW